MLPPQDLLALARQGSSSSESVQDGELLTQDALFSVLTRRHHLGLPYTRVGTSTLIAVNPNHALNIYTEANGQLYVDLALTQQQQQQQAQTQSPQQQRPGTTAATSSLEPHIFELATTMHFHMKRTELDQGVVLR